ncbi:hypothetical protein FJ492_27485 [Mesorhizobium sp. B2-5-4]|uniref:hypothetical protein n=1 Tax=Mesorhizobium sp. B2-5-4 TaxID=2589926 RepID=UPI001127E394|nr:hypothetical protein [Mesorhizobium sp. B2-5-4]TPK32470.1 hypothetical protein FJ492_27485 [Mesorhizobium sp. B2-5-4]
MAVPDDDDPDKLSTFALRRRRDRFRKELRDLLSIAEPTEFLQLVWSLASLHEGEFGRARRFGPNFGPQEMEQAKERFRFAPWLLETLVNEYLTTSLKSGPRRLNVQNHNAANALISKLVELENAEDGVWLKTGNILHLVGHLAQRQFPWQRGYDYFLQLYRSLFVFDFPDALARFEENVGISVERFAFCGFALRAHLQDRPFASMSIDLSEVKISERERDIVFKKLSLPLLQARRTASTLRGEAGLTGYKKSALRLSPCIVLPGGTHLMAPLPALITLRISNGIYYDIVGPGGINEQMGKRFEDYVAMLIDGFLPEITAIREKPYAPKKGMNYRSSDLALLSGGTVSLLIECKAKRASHASKFAESAAEAEGLTDLAYGIFQVWRHIAHRRLGHVDGDLKFSLAIKGVLLTLDTWADMSSTLQAEIFRLAHEIRQAKGAEIIEEDLIPVGFMHIQDFEGLLSTATASSLIAAVELWLHHPEYKGWSLWSVHDRNPGREPIDERPLFDTFPKPSGMRWLTREAVVMPAQERQGSDN